MTEASDAQDLESDSGAPVQDDGDARRRFGELRELLLGRERRRIAELERRLDELEIDPEELADLLPDAVALRTARDKQLARSLAPTLQEAFGESVQRDPQHIANAIFPILGPAIRKAIAETMAGFVNTLNRAIEHSLSIRGLKWRIEALRTGVPYPQIVIKHALVYRVEQVFLIHGETGLLLSQATAEDLDGQDADLISGMLTAIRDFVQDSFGSGEEGDGGLRTFSVGERTVLVEQGPKALLAAVVRGQHPASLLERLQAALETIHLHFALALNEFAGDSAPFEAAQPLLEECLETVLTTDRPSTRGSAPILAWMVAGAVVLLLAALWTRSTLRWNRAIAALRNEPGIVVVDAERGLRGRHISGLYDPLARQPASLLLDARVDTTRVDTRWEPYLSFDPPIVVARARRALGAPETLQLALAGDTLVAAGEATYDWMSYARSHVALIPGVTNLSLANVASVLPADLADLKRRIEEERVLFEIGSAAFVGPAHDLISRVAEVCVQLKEAGDAAGYDISLQIVGRTDSTGSSETNRPLSQERARRVREALAARGVPRAMMTAEGIGAADPVPSEDPETRAALNRSVSVIAAVTYRAGGGGGQE